MARIKTALISVYDKTGIVDLCKVLVSLDIKIIATSGTARVLKDAGLDVVESSEHTGLPELMGGRLKTLHCKLLGGISARRSNPVDMVSAKNEGIEPIDMVVVNLFPFEKITSKEDVKFSEAIENIDIGGPTIIRSAAQNFQDVLVVVDAKDYGWLGDELRSSQADIGYNTRLSLATKAFELTSLHDYTVSQYFAKVGGKETDFPQELTLGFHLGSRLRYGENPHQKAAVYFERSGGLNINSAHQIQGKEMSFNNYYDTSTAMLLATEFGRPCCTIVKHGNPCGCALGQTSLEAYIKAAKTDPVSAFGAAIAFNMPVDGFAAESLVTTFVEVIIAPSYTPEALEIFKRRPNVRVLAMPDMYAETLTGWDIKRIVGGILVQDWDTRKVDINGIRAVTKRQPTEDELQGLVFAWRVSKHVKTNAIVYALKDRTVGIGVGQTSRVSSAKIGAINALEPLKGTVVASDGFFPFRDAIDAIHKVGVTAVIQPGGAHKDQEVIDAADEHDMAMILTNIRHFKH